MALIIEDGSNVVGANSHVTLAETRAFALLRGVTLSIVDSEVEIQVIKAMDYLESLRGKYQGRKANEIQALQWPRINVYIDNVLFSSSAIPTELKNAECQLIIDVNNEIDLLPTTVGYGVKKEVIGPIETEYFDNIGSETANLRNVDIWLAPLFKSSFGYMSTLRV